MTAVDDINRVLREFKRYTGDGLPGAPTGAPLPVGDPQSGVHNPVKADMRGAFGGLLTEAEASADAAEAARALAVAAADTASAVGGSAVPNYATVAAATAATIPAARTYVLTAGYTAAGDGGGAIYKRVTAQPAHLGRFRSVDRFMPNGSTDSTNGGWWEIAEAYPSARQFGAKGDGVTNDQAALQNFLNYGASSGVPPVSRPFYVANFTARIGDGTFNIATPLILPAGVSIEMESGTRIVATAVMDAVIKTAEAGTTDQHNNTFIRGGTIDCAGLADAAIWPKYFAKFTIADLQTYNALDYHIRLGSLAAPAASYEAFIRNVLCRRDLTTYPTDLKGIHFENCGDSHLSDVIIMGVRYGVSGTVYDSKFDRVHVWNATQHGLLSAGFAITGSENIFTQCQIDAPFVGGGSGFYFISPRNVVLGCSMNHFGSDLDCQGIFLESGAHTIIIGCTWKGASASERITTDVEGDVSGSTMLANHTSNVSVPKGVRNTGWAAMTGTPNENTVYATGSVTLPQLAGRVAALQAALTTIGLIGP